MNEQPIKSPPLGIMPRRIWLIQRAQALAEAITRYLYQGAHYTPEQVKSMQMWADELAGITREMEAE